MFLSLSMCYILYIRSFYAFTVSRLMVSMIHTIHILGREVLPNCEQRNEE